MVSPTSMHRQPLLDLLARYAARHPEEVETVTRFQDFVSRATDCFERHLAEGHITGSAWIVDGSGSRVLLTHHRKLDRWLQPGGHADGDPDVLAVALREGLEETGLATLEPVFTEIFDLDIHRIPARGGDAEHLHYDVRFLLRDTGSGDYVVSEESHDLAWVPLGELGRYTGEESMRRMCGKCGAYFRTAKSRLSVRMKSVPFAGTIEARMFTLCDSPKTVALSTSPPSGPALKTNTSPRWLIT